MTNEKLNEILKSITGKSLSSFSVSTENLSKPKQFAHKVIDAFDVMATANAKKKFTQSVWGSIKWYMKNEIIPKKSDEEIITDLKNIKKTIDPLFETLSKAEDVLEYRKLNSSSIGIKSQQQKFVENLPVYKEALEVLDEL